MEGFGYKVAKSVYLTAANQNLDSDAIIAELGLPIFVKPCDSGSSYGIAKVKEKDQLQSAVDAAFRGAEQAFPAGILKAAKREAIAQINESIEKNFEFNEIDKSKY